MKTTQETTIAPMTASDIEDVVAIEDASFPSKWQAGAYENELRNKNAYYVVAKSDARVVGYAGMWTTHDEAHVTTIAVHPDMRRRGIGEQLLLALLERARKLKVTRMTLEVREGNEPARQLYSKHGFVPIAHLHRYYTDTGEDGIVMWLNPLPSPQPEPMRLIVLKSVHDTMRAEQMLKAEGVPYRIIPKPAALGADCGLAIIFDAEHQGAVRDLLAGERMAIEVTSDYSAKRRKE